MERRFHLDYGKISFTRAAIGIIILLPLILFPPYAVYLTNISYLTVPPVLVVHVLLEIHYSFNIIAFIYYLQKQSVLWSWEKKYIIKSAKLIHGFLFHFFFQIVSLLDKIYGKCARNYLEQKIQWKLSSL